MIKGLLSKLFGKSSNEYAPLFTGKVRPPNVPDNWVGAALPQSQGWAWTDPENHGDCVRIYAGDEPFIIVTKDGMVIGGDGKPTGERLDD